MRSRLALLVIAVALSRSVAGENKYVVEGISLRPQLITPFSVASIDISDARLRAILEEPLLTRLRTSGIATSGGRHVLRFFVQLREEAAPALGTAVLVQFQVLEPVQVYQGARNVAEYPEFTVWQAHELLLLPPLSEAFSQDSAVTAAAERLLTAFLKAVKDVTPAKPRFVIPNECPEMESKTGA
jgi:hypothetical protein